MVNPGYKCATLEPNAKIGTVTSITDIATKTVDHNSSPAIVEDLDLSSADFTSEQQVVLQVFLNKLSDVFAKSDSDLGHTNISEHSIDTQGHKPIYQRPYHIEMQHKVVDGHVTDMAMEALLSGVPWESCLVYLDDIIIFSHMFEEHLVRLAVADPDRVPCRPELSQILQNKMIFHYIQVKVI